jgi:glycosyltransferase involved in cell wall biosynthesis
MTQRIAVFLPSLAGGGAERGMIDVARGLAEAGLEVDLVAGRAAGEYSDRVPANVRVLDLHRRRVLFAIPALAAYLRRRRPDVLLTAMIHANLAGIVARFLAGARTRVVISERVAFASIGSHAPIKYRFVARWRRLVYPRANRIVAVSAGVADELVERCGISRERIDVIANPVVMPELESMACQPVDHPWFRPGAVPVILGVGRLKAQKDFAGLIEAFARVRADRECKLLILGEGPERVALESLRTRLDLELEIDLPGYTPNPYAYMRGAALFVLSSRWEGLPGVLIEAMAVGCPVVSTDCPAGPRQILRDGALAPLVPCEDPQALAAANAAALDVPPAVAP